MKSTFIAGGFAAVLLGSFSVMACENFAGTFSSTSWEFGNSTYSLSNRVIKITQNDCDIKVDLDNGFGHFSTYPDVVKADGIAYDRSHENMDNSGHVINPFKLATPENTKQVRTSIIGGALVIAELSGEYIGGGAVKNCKEELISQEGCSYLQRVFTLRGNDFVETQNGYAYLSGINFPTVIRYRRKN